MYDDTSAGVLKVFISDLTAADEATYRCGVNIADDHLFTEIKLKISQGKELPLSSSSNEKIRFEFLISLLFLCV